MTIVKVRGEGWVGGGGWFAVGCIKGDLREYV